MSFRRGEWAKDVDTALDGIAHTAGDAERMGPDDSATVADTVILDREVQGMAGDEEAQDHGVPGMVWGTEVTDHGVRGGVSLGTNLLYSEVQHQAEMRRRPPTTAVVAG